MLQITNRATEVIDNLTPSIMTFVDDLYMEVSNYYLLEADISMVIAFMGIIDIHVKLCDSLRLSNP